MECDTRFYQTGQIHVNLLKLMHVLHNAALQFSIHLPEALFRITFEKNSRPAPFVSKADGLDLLPFSCASDRPHS